MANTIAGVNLAQIAQKSLDALMVALLPARAFTLDFSDEVAQTGESVTTRVPTQPAIQDFDVTTTAADVTLTSKTVTLNNYKGVKIQFTDSEVAKSKIDLVSVFYNPIANTVGKAVLDAAFALVTNATYGAAGLVSSAANFDTDDVADLAQTLTTANVPQNDRHLIVAPTYWASLVKDGSVQAALNYGSPDAIRDNKIPRLHGFLPIEYNAVPANGENLVGVACCKPAILIAARVPAIPANFPGEIQQATEPESGLTVQVRRWYSADTRKLCMEMGIIFGVAAGVTGNLKRITSA